MRILATTCDRRSIGRLLPPWLALALLSTSTGCNSSDYELAPVTGTISVDGRPLGVGKVMFAPVARSDAIEPGKPAIGRLQPDGTFELSTYQPGDGAVVGPHWVTVYGPSKDGPDFPPGMPRFERITVRDGTRQVAADTENRFDIDIRAEDIRKFARKSD
jgi:hypothetical protein